MHRILPNLLLAACLTGGAGTASALDTLHAHTLADHTPAQMQDDESSADALVEQGQIAMVSMQFDLAAQRYCQAARMNSAEGHYRLGRLLLQQRGLRRALAQARYLLDRAAELGNDDARLLVSTGTAFAGQEAQRPDCMPERVHVALPPPGWVPPSFEPTAQVISAGEVERYVRQLPLERRVWAQRIQERAPFFGVDPRLALSLVRAESNFDPNALSAAHAQGLMQLIPETAQRFGVTDLHDPGQNIEAGLAYLRWLLHRFDDDVIKTTAAYNAGEGAVERYNGVPPYPETQAYVERILRFYRATLHTTPPAPRLQRAKLGRNRPRQQG
jgi:soluble lytic murein transglycosylase-like protein